MASQKPVGPRRAEGVRLRPGAGPLIGVTGLFSLLTPVRRLDHQSGGAISAAICTGPDVHPDPAERWKTGPFYALAYLVFAAFGARWWPSSRFCRKA